MKKAPVLHPFFLAIFPIIFLYDHNLAETQTYQIVVPLLLSIGATLALLGLVWGLTRNLLKTALIVSLVSISFFNYGRAYSTVAKLGFSALTDNLPWLTVALLLLPIIMTVRTKMDLGKLTGLLNISVGTMVAISLISIGTKTVTNSNVWDEIGGNSPAANLDATAITHEGELPDIYYLVLDSYPRADTLRDIYSFDNTKFIDGLENRGFFVAKKSRSNYAQTYFSLASSLNMEHIDYLSKPVGPRTKTTAIPARMIEDNKVMRFVKSLGYMTIHFRSGWSGTDDNKFADLEIDYGSGDEFTMLLMHATALRPFEARLGLVPSRARKRTLSIFDRLGQIPSIEEPTFTFAHLVPPHPPYFFGANGEKVPRPKLKMQGLVWTQKQKFLDQLVFVNGKVTMLIDELLAGSDEPPIIIIQSDHGSASTFYTERKGGWERPTDRQLKERMRNLNAIYAPRIEQNKFREDLSPVNNFRFVFNEYLDANFEMQDNKSLYSDYQTPFVFTDVTRRITR